MLSFTQRACAFFFAGYEGSFVEVVLGFEGGVDLFVVVEALVEFALVNGFAFGESDLAVTFSVSVFE